MEQPHELILTITSLAETDRLGRAIAGLLRGGEVIGLIGPLGAGKTRLTRAIAEALGVDSGAIGSPTFTLIHEYSGRLTLYHFDTYRLKSPDEFDDLDPAACWSQPDGVCLIEWADKVWDRLPPESWRVALQPQGEQTRLVQIAIPDAERLLSLRNALGDQHARSV